MFRRCLGKLLEKQLINEHEIYRYDDIDIISSARAVNGFIGDIMRRLDNRQLFKRVYSLKLNDIPNPEDIFKMSINSIKKAENDIALDIGAGEEYIMVDIPEYPSFHEMTTPVSVNGDIVPLGDISNLVRALKDARFNHADLCIYLPEKYSEKASELNFIDYLDIPD